MSILTEILEVKKNEVYDLKKKYTLSSFQTMEFFEKQNKKFYEPVKNSANIAVISEVKKASPSKGLIKPDFNHLKIAEQYIEGGADAISVLTDKQFFQGNIEFLKDIAKLDAKPLLRKDFIIDEFQVLEAKANGADLILLICEALSKSQIKDLTQTASEIGLEVLLELHSKDQLEKIDFNTNKIIGVNNRNLKNFSVDLSTTLELSKFLPNDILLIAESGISKKEDLDFLKNTGANAVLVGEHLMRSNNIKSGLQELKEWCMRES